MKTWGFLFSCFVLQGCTASTPTLPSDGFDRRGLVESLGKKVILPAIQEARSEAQALQASTSAWANSSGADESLRLNAQAAWKRTMAAWQVTEMLAVGPSAPSSWVGGANLRDEIYSWPTTNACRVDQAIVENRFDKEIYFSTALVTTRGLDALEYVLFSNDPTNACPEDAALNAQGLWGQLNAQELQLRRARYADAVTTQLLSDFERLVQAWEKEGGYLEQLEKAGTQDSLYSSAQDAIDEFYAATFYLDSKVKDLKLAMPLGLTGACATTRCPDKVESRFAQHSKENITANLKGLLRLYVGNTPLEFEAQGFDDFLVARGAAEFSNQLTSDLQKAISLSEALTPSLEKALENDAASVEALHQAVKGISTSFKSQLATVLNLKVPDEGASDND